MRGADRRHERCVARAPCASRGWLVSARPSWRRLRAPRPAARQRACSAVERRPPRTAEVRSPARTIWRRRSRIRARASSAIPSARPMRHVRRAGDVGNRHGRDALLRPRERRARRAGHVFLSRRGYLQRRAGDLRASLVRRPTASRHAVTPSPSTPTPSTLTIDGAPCANLDVARTAQGGDGHLWTVTIGATCPVLGAVSVLAQGDDNSHYPGERRVFRRIRSSPGTPRPQVELLVICGEGDAGCLATADAAPRGSGTFDITTGPIEGYEKAPIAFTATNQNDGSPPHAISALAGRSP